MYIPKVQYIVAAFVLFVVTLVGIASFLRTGTEVINTGELLFVSGITGVGAFIAAVASKKPFLNNKLFMLLIAFSGTISWAIIVSEESLIIKAFSVVEIVDMSSFITFLISGCIATYSAFAFPASIIAKFIIFFVDKNKTKAVS